MFNDIQNTVSNILSNPFATEEKVKKNKRPYTIAEDELSQLHPCYITDKNHNMIIDFPVTSISTEVKNRIIEHNRMNRNGAILESTGLDSMKFNVVAPFCNGIVKGKYEAWRNLYPETYRKFLEFVSTYSNDVFIFNHPDLGEQKVKISELKTPINAEYRNGVLVEFTLITDHSDDEVFAINQSYIELAKQAAVDFDNVVKAMIPPPDTGLEKDGFKSFLDAIDKITAKVDQVGLLQKQVLGKIDRVIGRIRRLTDSLQRTLGGLGNLPADFVSRGNALIFQLRRLKKTIGLDQSRKLAVFQTKKEMTLLQVAIATRTKPKELMNMNPHISQYQDKIPRFTLIKYYKD